ncbi:MAG: HAMP domain-containing histidine kinase [Patescibacteria group bacterium]|nr:HAMP domain-containing histidine kinase [Patescibacteria group bacterium]
MNNLFFKTQLRLTGLYIVIIVILLFIFSQIIYISVSNNIRGNVEGDFLTKQQEITFVQKQINNLQVTLISANIIILLIVTGLSYFLARKTLVPVQRSMEQQKQFLSDASHELRTPLAILQTNLDNILKEKKKGSKDFQDTLSNMEEVGKMTSLVNELLLLSRLDTANSPISLIRINIAELLQNTVKRLISYANSKQVFLKITHTSSKPLIIMGSSDILSQAIANVIKNAIDYNRKNGKVFISLEKKGEMVAIVVSDTGLGISAKHLPYIFNRFYKGEESRSEHKGTGLGLAISKDIVTKHKGTIRIRSTSFKGTTVNIFFPLISTSQNRHFPYLL